MKHLNLIYQTFRWEVFAKVQLRDRSIEEAYLDKNAVIAFNAGDNTMVDILVPKSREHGSYFHVVKKTVPASMIEVVEIRIDDD